MGEYIRAATGGILAQITPEGAGTGLAVIKAVHMTYDIVQAATACNMCGRIVEHFLDHIIARARLTVLTEIAAVDVS